MLEIDGTAIPLEPGKHYVVIYDSNRVDPYVVEGLMKWTRGLGSTPFWSQSREALRPCE